MNDIMYTLKTLAGSALAISIIITIHEVCWAIQPGCGGSIY